MSILFSGTEEKAMSITETTLNNLAYSLEKDNDCIVDKNGIQYEAGMIRSVAKVLSDISEARRANNGC